MEVAPVVEAPAVEAPRPVEVARGSHEWPRQRRCIDGDPGADGRVQGGIAGGRRSRAG
jgi:hypothetical protein